MRLTIFFVSNALASLSLIKRSVLGQNERLGPDDGDIAGVTEGGADATDLNMSVMFPATLDPESGSQPHRHQTTEPAEKELHLRTALKNGYPLGRA